MSIEKVVIIEHKSRGIAIKITDPEEIENFELCREKKFPVAITVDGGDFNFSPWDESEWYYKCFKPTQTSEEFLYFDSFTMTVK